MTTAKLDSIQEGYKEM